MNADTERRAAWLCWAGLFHNLTGASPDVPMAYCREAVEIANENGLDDMRALAESCLTQAYTAAGRLTEAVETGVRALAFFEAHSNTWWACRVSWSLIVACNAIGRWAQSLEYCRRALEYGRTVDDLRLKVVGWWRTGSTHIQRGDAETGVACCDQALALSPLPLDAAMARGVRAYGLVKVGKGEEAIAQLEDVVAWLQKSNLRYSWTIWGLYLADSYLRLGESRRARAVAESCLAVSREIGYRYLQGVAERLLGQSLAPDDPAASAAHLTRAVEILEEAGARNDLAKTLVAQAELRIASGDPTARSLLDRALTIFSELGTLDGPDHARRLLAALPAS